MVANGECVVEDGFGRTVEDEEREALAAAEVVDAAVETRAVARETEIAGRFARDVLDAHRTTFIQSNSSPLNYYVVSELNLIVMSISN